MPRSVRSCIMRKGPSASCTTTPTSTVISIRDRKLFGRKSFPKMQSRSLLKPARRTSLRPRFAWAGMLAGLIFTRYRNPRGGRNCRGFTEKHEVSGNSFGVVAPAMSDFRYSKRSCTGSTGTREFNSFGRAGPPHAVSRERSHRKLPALFRARLAL